MGRGKGVGAGGVIGRDGAGGGADGDFHGHGGDC
jgi:hypothetical protein